MTIIRLTLLLIFPLIFSCAGIYTSSWKAYVFDGINFLPSDDISANTIWVRSGHFPTTEKPDTEAAGSDKLPSGNGAVAGICYIQTTGGRISEQNLFTPYPDEQITFTSRAEGVSVTRTDKDGYFIEYLPPGDYELYCRGVKRAFRIKKGETTLVPIRGGKRMAD